MKTELKQVDSSTLGISKRAQVAVGKDRNYYIIKNIKSRIIMKDGKKIVETARIIKNQTNKQVFLATSAPVCSKTKKFLDQNSEQIINFIRNSNSRTL